MIPSPLTLCLTNTLVFTATVFRNDCGFVARADELSVFSEPATTQRGAIRNLKDAVLRHLTEASKKGKLTALLDDAGYKGSLVRSTRQVRLEVMIYDRKSISVRVPRKAPNSALDRDRSGK
jgi:hypothetical protein